MMIPILIVWTGLDRNRITPTDALPPTHLSSPEPLAAQQPNPVAVLAVSAFLKKRKSKVKEKVNCTAMFPQYTLTRRRPNVQDYLLRS